MSNRATNTLGAPNQEKHGLFLDIDAARAQLGPTRLIEVYTSFKQAVSNHLLDMPEVRETIQTGRPVDIAAREIRRFQAEQRLFHMFVTNLQTHEEDLALGFNNLTTIPDEAEEETGQPRGNQPRNAAAKDTVKGRGRTPPNQKATVEKDASETRFNVPQTQADDRAKEDRKIALDQAKAVVKALIEYQKDCQEAVKSLFNTTVLSKSIITGIDSILGEHDKERHFVAGYGPPPSPEDPAVTKDNGRRRYAVARARGYICVLFQALEALFAPKVRQNEKTLLLKEFFLFAPKQNEAANQVIKRFYDRVHDIRVAGIEIPADQQMVILLEALSHDPMVTERIIQLKEEIERGEGV